MFTLFAIYYYLATGIGIVYIVFGLLFYLITQNLTIFFIGSILLISVPLIEKLWKAKLNKTIEEKTKEKVLLRGVFSRSENLYNGTGYLTMTENHLVFVNIKNKDVYVFNINEIVSYIIGRRATGNYVFINNVALQGGKRVIEIVLNNGDHLSWKISSANLPYINFEKTFARRLRSEIDKYKIG